MPSTVLMRGTQAGLQVADQDAELLDPVLHRRAGEEQHPARSPRPTGRDRLGALGGQVLHVVRLVDHEHAEVHSRGLAQRPQGVVGRDGDAACARPRPEVLRGGRRRAAGAARSSLCRLISWIQLTRTLAGHTTRKCRRAFDAQVAHGGQGLHGLAQAHLVAEHRLLLAERELRAERLVAAQGGAHQREVERVLVDPPRDVGRDEALPGFDVGRELADLDEQPVVEDGAFLVVPPQGRVSAAAFAQPGRRGSPAAGCPGPTGAPTSSGPRAG